jgi:uncharacterized protein (TIGR02996 family)
MTTEAGIIANVLANPTDAHARLVYADYLAERDRYEEEEDMRGEAAAVLAAVGAGSVPGCAMTIGDVQMVTDKERQDFANDWARRQRRLIIRAVLAEAIDAGIAAALDTDDGRFALKIDERFITVEIEHGVAPRWNYNGNKRPTCRVSVGYPEKKNFPMGKHGFTVRKVVAEVLRQLKSLRERDQRREQQEETETAARSAYESLRDRFGLKYGVLEYEGRKLSLSLPAEQMERALEVLKAAGIINTKTEGGAL